MNMCSCVKSPTSWWLWMGGSIIVAVAAVAAALSWNAIFNALLSSVLVLSPSSVTYKRWVAPEQPLFFEVFLFNWTNADRFTTEKPKFEQIGPYRFREIRKHVNVTFHPQNSSVAYRTQRSWFFDSSSSNGTLKDNVTTINFMTLMALKEFHDGHTPPWVALWMYELTLKGFDVLSASVTKTVGEILFDGYANGLSSMSKYFNKPNAPTMDRFGWFYTRNNSIDTDGYVEVTSGADGMQLGQILKWNHQDSMPFYKGQCSKLEGSVGEFITRNLTENSTLTMFVPDLCRTVHLKYVHSAVLKGLKYHKFELDESCFDKSSTTNENNCFCNGACRWSGTMNVSACRFDAPIVLSLPHFLYADPALREAVEGMAPDPEKHSFYFAVEPTLGVPLDVAGRFQFNVFLEPTVSIFKKAPKMLFPILWVQQHVIVTDDIFKELRVVVGVGQWGGLVLAVIGLTSAAITVIYSNHKPKYISISAG